TLFDLLFGPREATPPPRAIPHTPTSQPRATPTPTPVAPVPDAVEKTEGATRLAVFGDSLAVDLAKALQRAYAEDPNMVIVGKGVGSSGFVRDDFYDWNAALAEEIAADSFDLAVLIIGINDRQPIGSASPLSDEWKAAYLERLNQFLGQLRVAGKPVIWVGLPPMRAPTYSAAISEISSLHRLASVTAGVEFVDIYERFTDEEGKFTSRGPDLNGNDALMRKSDGIHFSAAGSDKLVFFINQSLRLYYRGGTVSIEVADPLEGTDAQTMVRLPYQGTGQVRLLQIAGAVLPISSEPPRASELLLATPDVPVSNPFDMQMMLNAPRGRADAFGVGIEPGLDQEAEPSPATIQDVSAAGQ
ncbi:MAG TPA: DUF459 domain-containing protein, partial [Devosia sp.]|nr:DUF459 domain-containing protein [Devosia sp.]